MQLSQEASLSAQRESRVAIGGVFSRIENKTCLFVFRTCKVSANVRRIKGTMLGFLFWVLPLLWGLPHAANIPRPVSLAATESNLTLNGVTFPRPNLEYVIRALSLRAESHVDSGHPHALKLPTRFPIPHTDITLYLSDYGDRLPEGDIYGCLQDASAYLVRMITLRGDVSMAARTWRRNNVALIATPSPAMSLLKAIEVVDELEMIVVEHRWTFATQVLVLDARLGGLGSFNIAYRSPVPMLPAHGEASSSDIKNY